MQRWARVEVSVVPGNGTTAAAVALVICHFGGAGREPPGREFHE